MLWIYTIYINYNDVVVICTFCWVVRRMHLFNWRLIVQLYQLVNRGPFVSLFTPTQAIKHPDCTTKNVRALVNQPFHHMGRFAPLSECLSRLLEQVIISFNYTPIQAIKQPHYSTKNMRALVIQPFHHMGRFAPCLSDLSRSHVQDMIWPDHTPITTIKYPNYWTKNGRALV